MPATAKPYMLPGENLNDPATNVAIHNRIMQDYARRWPNDPARWAVAYFSGPGNVSQPGSPTPYIKNTSDGHNTVAQYVANTAGKAGSATPNAGAAATPGTTLNTPPPATAIANALTGGTGADGKGLSPIQQAQQAFGGEGGGQALPPAAPPQLGMPSMHNQEVAAQAPQLMAALRASAAQPLSWGSQPFGSTAGSRAPPTTIGYFGGQAIPMPGTTLNSIGGQANG